MGAPVLVGGGARALKTITVAELRELLEGYHPDARVIVSADYGDRARTQQALGLKGDIDEVALYPSAYSTSGFAVADDDREPTDLADTFLLLS